MNELNFGTLRLCLFFLPSRRSTRFRLTSLSPFTRVGAPLPPGMAALLQARLPPPIVRDVMLTAHRYTAPEALKAGIVDMVVEADGTTACVERAVEYAKGVKGLAATGVRTASFSSRLSFPLLFSFSPFRVLNNTF